MASDPLLAAAYVVHFLFAALWTGSVLFVAYAVLPLGLAGDVGPDPLRAVAGKLAVVSRASALLLLVSGGYQAATLYSAADLTGTPRGHAVLGMVALWLLLAGLTEVGVARMRDGLSERKVRTPAAEARPFLLAATVVAVLLTVDAGVLAAGLV